MVFAVALATALLVAQSHRPAGAQTNLQLDMPVACNVHIDCWIVNYFDSKPGPGAYDYNGGIRTYDNHRGTDFAVRDLVAMKSGVPVLAAADGTVRARRDGMEDATLHKTGRVAINGRECGNGVVIDHAPGWATQYCHLRKGSVRVSSGQVVKTGDVIGFVRQSGLAQFPHLHLNVLRDGKKIDPFAIDGGVTKLWSAAARSQLSYEPTSVYGAGFRQAAPDTSLVKQGNIQNQAISTTSPAIVFWTGIFGVRTGDKLKQTLHGPKGQIIAEREVVQKKNQVRRFLWTGKKRDAGQWPAGDYIGRTTVISVAGGGQKTYTREEKIRVTASSGD